MEDPSLKLKEQVQLICTLLCDEYGEQSLFLSVNPSNQTSTYMGSTQGKEFLQNRMDIIEQFYNQCSGQQLIVPIKLKKDEVTMTEYAGSPESNSRFREPESASQNTEMKRNQPDVQSKTGPSTDVSFFKANKLTPPCDKIIRDIQSVAVENIESVSDISQHNKRLGDIFEEELNGDGNSDSGSLIEDQYDPNENTQPKLACSLVPRAERYRKRSVAKYMRDDHYECIDFKVNTKTTQSKPLKIKVGQVHSEEKEDNDGNIMETEAKMKPIKIRPLPAREKDKMFDIYVSGQRMLHSVKELQEYELQTSDNTEECNISETENMCDVISIVSQNTRYSKSKHLQGINLSALDSTKTRLYVNFKDIQEQEIKPVKTEETEEPKLESEPIDIRQRSDGRYICPECGQAFPRRDTVYWHVKIVHLGQSPFKCDFCGKLFRLSTELHRHTISHIRKKHIGNTPFVCDICLETFPSKRYLKDHMATHKKYVCELCGKTFSKQSYHLSHRRTHELKDVTPSFKCPDPGCDLVFKTQRRLDLHLAYKTAEKNFVCDMCGYKTKLKQSLEKHLERKHSEERKPEYYCEQCNKYFYQNQNYTVHMENHRGMARYVCDCCNMAFASSSTLKRHYLRKAGLYVRPKSKNNKS